MATASNRSMGSAFRANENQPRGQLGPRRGGATAHTRAKKVLPRAAATAAGAIVACMLGGGRGETLPMSLPTSTTSVSLASKGYSGTIPTEFGYLAEVTAVSLCR